MRIWRLVLSSILVGLLCLALTFAPVLGADFTPLTGGFLAQYFNNPDLEGAPTTTRTESALAFNWAGGSPDPAITADHFSARWIGTITVLAPGNYTFNLTADDGARLWVDGGDARIDKWLNQPATSYTTTIFLAAGAHDLKAEYFEYTGQASFSLAWRASDPAPVGTAFTAEYFNNMTLSGTPVGQSSEAAIDFSWGEGSPGPSVNTDYFSGRYTGTVVFPETGDVDFHIFVDDGARLWLDGIKILDAWYPQAGTEHVAPTQHVLAGAHDIRMEYFDETGQAAARLWWTTHGGGGTVIVDDLGNGFSRSGSWHEAGTGYAAHMYWTQTAATLQESWGRWTPSLQAAGRYEIQVFIPGSNASTRNARYVVRHNGVSSNVSVNQLSYSNEWVNLGTFFFLANGEEYVSLSDVTGEPNLSHRIGFDAVKFIYRGG